MELYDDYQEDDFYLKYFKHLRKPKFLIYKILLPSIFIEYIPCVIIELIFPNAIRILHSIQKNSNFISTN